MCTPAGVIHQRRLNKDNDPRIGFRVNGSKTFLANSLWHGTTDH